MADALEYFRDVYREAARSAQSLAATLPRLPDSYWPEALETLDMDAKDRLDAFCVRFIRLQDALGRGVFRALLAAELEDTADLTQLDILHRMEKRAIVDSVETWAVLRRLRNLLAHEYPDAPHKRAEALNSAIRYAPVLLAALQRTRTYAADRLGLQDLEPV